MKDFIRVLTCTASAYLAIAAIDASGRYVWTYANAADTQTVTLRFDARVGDQPFHCDQSYTLGMSASPVVPLDFRFYVSDVALIDATGNIVPLTLEQDGQWQYESVALLDFEDKAAGCANGTVEMNDRIIGTVPTGDYTGLQFTLGVPFDLNHADATLAASPLNLTSLWWNWQSGYKFARIDFGRQHSMGLIPIHSTHSSPDEHGHESATGFAIHLGSTACEITDGGSSPTRCHHPNRAAIVLNEFDPATNVIVADVAALVANTDLSVNQPNTAPGCMSDPSDRDCAGIMSALGIPFADMPVVHQTFFRVE